MDFQYTFIKYLFRTFGTTKFLDFNLPNKRSDDYSDAADANRKNETSYLFKNHGQDTAIATILCPPNSLHRKKIVYSPNI